jgi:PAS domain S-box-containing protein
MRFTEYNQDGLLRPLDLVLAAGEGVPGVVAETRTRYVTHAPQAQPHPAYGGPPIHIRGLIDVPILSRDGQLLGCLELHNPRDEQGFDDQDVSMLEGLASGAAVALENARLLEERQRVEEDLRQLKEFNEDIVLSMGEGILVQDRLGHFSFVNPAAAAMLGYRPEELLQASWRTIVPPDQHAIVNAVDADRVRGAASRYELEFVCKDGRRLAALVSGSPRFKDGRFEGMLAVFADISERKAAEQALRESEEQFRSVAERSPNMIFINQRGHIVYVNPQCSEVMAYRPEEFLSPDFRFETLVAPDSLATVREAFSRHGRGEDVAPYEYELVTRNGKLLTVINATKLITFRGAPAILGVVTDITERKRAEEAVRESERRFRLLVERAADAVFLHDLEGRIVDVNQQACGSLGYTRDELLGMRVDDVEAQVDPAAQRDLWRQAAAGPQTLEGTHRRKDGSTFPVELRIGAFDVDGRPHILALARDISERRRADEALRETTQTLQALVQAAPVGVVVLDLQGNIRIWNPAAERIFRVSAGNVVDQALEALRSVNAENVAAFVGIQEQLMRGEAVSNTEVKAFRSDGVPLDVAISAAPLRDAEGHVQALMGVLDDITERKRAEVAIERHMRELSVLYETSLEVAQRSDAHQILEVIVAQAAGLMGARMGGIYLLSDDGSSLELAVIHNLPETLRGTRLALGEGLSGKVAQSGAAMTVEDYAVWAGRFPGYEGAPFRRVAAAPLKRAGKVIGVINVTDSERTGPFEADEVRVLQLFADQAAVSLENARLLRETRQRAAHLEAVTALGTALRGRRTRREALPIVAEHLMDLLRPDGVLVALEDAGNQDVVVERGVGVWAGLEGARQGRAHGLLGRVMATGQAVVISGPGELREAREPLDLASASTLALIPLVEQEHVLGVIGVGRGSAFTEPERRLLMALAEVIGNALRRLAVLETLEERVRVRTQELADANLRLTELDRLKSDFVSNVSHELRTPITNVLLYLDLLEQPSRQDRREAYMTVLRRESERLGHLIEDLLTLSRMDQAALKVNLELRALDPLLGEIQASHRARALAKGIDLGLEPNPDVPPVWLDYAQIVQVLNNLVANAIAYTPSGGQVSLCSLLREAEGGRREAGARVHNDGPIIPAEDRPRLFERFFRGRTGRESGEPGTGLGLAICKEIVDRHGGWIEVESSEGEGTRFTVWLPLGAEG